jgi:hypothetical protein
VREGRSAKANDARSASVLPEVGAESASTSSSCIDLLGRLTLVDRLLLTDSKSLGLAEPEVHANAPKHRDSVPSRKRRLVDLPVGLMKRGQTEMTARFEWSHLKRARQGERFVEALAAFEPAPQVRETKLGTVLRSLPTHSSC